MAFWDGTRWVSDTTPAQPRRTSRWRDLAATGTMLIVAAALLLPFTASFASTAAPTMGLSPAAGPAGTAVAVTGDGFPVRSRIQLTWDAATQGMPIASVNGRGHFKVTITIPAAADGAHTIAANVAAAKTTTTAQVGATLASIVFTLASPPAATPGPTETPVPTTAPAATPVPTVAPAATPVPTPAATPVPTAPPTPGPTATPAPTAPPAPPAPPSPGQKIVQFSACVTASQFLILTKDVTVDVIEMASGSYPWDNVKIDVDRTARPLTIRPASGATVTFTGNGSTTAGILFFGLNSATKWITMDGVTPGGFTFSGIALAQAGVFEVRSSDHLTLRNMTFKNLSRDATYSDKAYKSWAAYVSTAGGRNNDHLLIDRWTLLAPAVYRDVSAIQVASSVVPNGSITLTNITMTKYAYGFYDEVPTANLLLDTWNLTDTGNHTTPASVRFTSVAINGMYKNITATLSDPLLNNSTGTMVNGG